MLGGFLVGVLENVLGAFVIGNELKLSVALVLIVGVLLVQALGLLRPGARDPRMKQEYFLDR